ncbi:MAG: 30S ribosomal protein S12 methylthiotransferase RimO [Deltaproteobacteria bacterium]|nr:30S ribosomal protein S12 methylthiotransferase RimO [Deltaproteobacteria bacterium]
MDAEMMLGFLKKDGFSFSNQPHESEVIVVNTCGFVEDSKKESIDQILEMAKYKSEGKCEVLVATGCLTQRYSEQLAKEMPEVDAFVGLSEFDRLSEILRQKFSTQKSDRVYVHSIELPSVQEKALSSFSPAKQILPDPDLPRVLSTPKHFTYIKVSEGCSHRCSFCIIPHIRGDLKSRSISSIVREVQSLVDQGVKEFNLIAQDLNEYGKDLRNSTNLTDLLIQLNKLPGDFWIRPLYMYPLEFTDRLIEVMKDSEHLVKYVDMPLQHINDRIMRSMKRGSPARYVRQVLDKLKNAMPEMAVRTTFIVGYPGETDAEFEELYQFLNDYQFDRVGVFQYSPEEGTCAAKLENPIPSKVKKERYHRLMQRQQEISLQKNQSLIGKTFRVLCDGVSEEDPLLVQGRLATQAPEIDGVTFISGEAETGEFAHVKIIGAQEYDLVGEVVG